MRTLFLLSKHFTESVHQEFLQTVSKKPGQIRILFCDNATDKEKEKGEVVIYVEKAKEELKTYGYQLDYLDLRELVGSKESVAALFHRYDATFFTGGSLWVLLDLFYQTGLIETYASLLEKGLIHIGFSAGALICSSEMKFYDELDTEYAEKKHEKGLGICPLYFIPHCFDKPKYTKIYETLKLKYPQVQYIPLSNTQAIVVKDRKWRILGGDSTV